MLDVGLRLKLFRISADLKQRVVAEKLGVTVNFVSMLERGEREPTLKYLKSFARVVKVPVSVLLWEPNDTSSEVEDKRDFQLRFAALITEYAKAIGIEKVES
jgi:transcriptional regulator with XRE-family HTH domain